MKFTRKTDLTAKPGNPAYELTQIYDELMTITIPELFIARIKGRIEGMVGHGFSESNYRQMMRNMANCIENPRRGETQIEALQKYVTNCILKASGNGVLA